jgi:hypothetical protein
VRISATPIVRFLIGVSLVLSACDAEPNARQSYVPAGGPLGQIGSDPDKPDDPWSAGSPPGGVIVQSPGPACSPAPCAVSGGLVIRFANLNRAWVPPSASSRFDVQPRTPKPGFHYVRIDLSFEAISGEHFVSADQVRLRDALGYSQSTTTAGTGNCGGLLAMTTIAAPAKFGPLTVCFEAGGPSDGSLAMLWYPGESSYASSPTTRGIVIPLD